MSSEIIGEVIIDLDNVFDLNRYDESTMLQYAAKAQLEQLLNGFVKNLEGYSEAKSCQPSSDKLLNNIFRSNNTIFINGQRGTGKTTFLRAMLDYYSNNDEGICPLAFIDPTLIETHQNILVDIVVKFKQLYDEKLKYCADEDINRQLNTCLEEMAEGLKLASHHKTNHDKHDDSWFLSQALKSAKSGQYLEERFHHFINEVAKALNKELFIIAIDDVDTHTQKAYEVLETIRRYLNHPRVVVLISGDLRLYNHIVKNQKQRELQSGGKQNNDEKETRDLVNHLTQQYMTKIFPAYQRIDLKSLIELIRYTCEVKVKYKKEIIGTTHLSSYVESILSDALKIKTEQVGLYRDFLLSQPMRSVVQILKKLLDKKSSNTSLSDSLRLSWKSIFIGELVDQGIDHVLMEYSDIDMNKIANAVFDLCYRHGELETGFYLRPDSDDDAYNATKIYLATMVSRLFEKKSLSNALRFMLVCGAAINIFMHYVDGLNEKRYDLFKNYKKYIGINRNENIMTLSSHLGAVIFLKLNNTNKTHGGLIRVNRRKINSKDFDEDGFKLSTGWGYSDVIGSLDRLSSDIDKKERGRDKYSYDYFDYVSAVAILASSFSVQDGAEKRDYISILNLLALIVKCLESENINIRNFISMQTYGNPNSIKEPLIFLSSNDNNESMDDSFEDSFSYDEYNDGENINNKNLNDDISEWRKSSGCYAKCSPLMIGKIWERLQYTLNSISEHANKEKSFYHLNGEKGDMILDVLFSRMISGVINSVLIEEIRFGIDVPPDLISLFSSARNVSSSSDELIINMNRVGRFIDKKSEWSFKDSLPFTYMMINFPLFIPFYSLVGLNPVQRGNRRSLLSLLNQMELLSCKGRLHIDNEILKNEKTMNREIKYFHISKLLIAGCFRKKL
ncbi:P-loop NTPase fold protein [Dickeya oryzae]|uniref:P-loop NTPase fold protein n=1 Tax=Dickeya oryzae TaxID=1240404 RepID=UPI0003AA684E|nr:P-loop NTPase fold protein [Dickeya oryzae]